MSKEGEEALPDLYDLFELPDSATEKEIQRAFRRQAVKFHPDKNPSVEAAKHFHLLTIALDLLLDTGRRATYDAGRRQKQETRLRREKIEGERRVWIDALERSEARAAGSQESRKRKRPDVAREEELARQGAALRAELKRDMDSQRAQQKVPQGGASSEQGLGQHGHSVSVRFRGRTVSAEEIKTVFDKFGAVMEVLYRPSGSKTQSALVEFATLDAAKAACSSNLSALAMRDVEFKSVQLADVSSSRAGADDKAASKQESDAARVPVESLATPVRGSSYESNILQKMKQRQREKLAAQQETQVS